MTVDDEACVRAIVREEVASAMETVLGRLLQYHAAAVVRGQAPAIISAAVHATEQHIRNNRRLDRH